MMAECTSASGNWRNQRDFVAFAQLVIARCVVLIHGDHRCYRESIAITEGAHMVDDVSNRRPVLDIELELGAANGVGVRGKEENGYGHGIPLHPTALPVDRKAF
jgi:hypothetical protein